MEMPKASDRTLPAMSLHLRSSKSGHTKIRGCCTPYQLACLRLEHSRVQAMPRHAPDQMLARSPSRSLSPRLITAGVCPSMLGEGGTAPVVSTWAGAVQVHRQPTIPRSLFVQQLEAEASEDAAAEGDSCIPGAADQFKSQYGAFTASRNWDRSWLHPSPGTVKFCLPLLCLAPVSQQGAC